MNYICSNALLVLTVRTLTSGMRLRKPWCGLAIDLTRYDNEPSQISQIAEAMSYILKLATVMSKTTRVQHDS